MDDLTKEFLAESEEGLERMERCLTELERRPGDGELLSEIFRSVHTIKGATGFLGFGRLERLAHAGENLLGALREGLLEASPEVISGLLQLMDGLRAILHLIEQTGAEGVRSTDDDHELIGYLEELKLGQGRLRAVEPPGFLGLGAELGAGERGGAMRAGGEVSPESALGAGLAGGLAGGVAGKAEQARAGAAVAAVASAASTMQDRTLRIDVEVLNRMMDLVGELVLTRNRILQSTPDVENFPELGRRLDNVTSELRETVMQARVQPVGHLFAKYPRMVRDLARVCGRRARVEFEGRETGLDKSLLEAVRDPLTHAVRNAVDHGIEPEAMRLAAGKPAEGVVRLRAFQQGGSVVIEVADDGAGIATARVLAKAVERGLVTAEQAAGMSEREALRLIFLPGFSTAREVTNVSGRGVGMDVVRANVERVGGRVEVESREGLGTTLRMRVPLTLAIVPALVVESGGQSFALPQNALIELVYVAGHEAVGAVERMGTTELYRLRDRLLPLVWLDRLLEIGRGAEASDGAGGDAVCGAETKGFYIAVVESEGCRYGLAVEELRAPEEIVVKPLSAMLREIKVFSGATVLGNGTLALILDVAATGARAGVRPVAEEMESASRQAEAVGVEAAEVAAESSLVVYEAGRMGEASERRAIPLSAVERIETVPVREIEFVGGRALVQYRGELLGLEDEGGLLRELRMAGAESLAVAVSGENEADAENKDEGPAVTVLICMMAGARGTRRVGIVVRRVLDVSAGRLLGANAEVCEGELAMVKDWVTVMHGGFPARVAGVAAVTLQEVA